MKFESKSIGAMHCGIDCSRCGTNMPDLDLFQIWNFAQTVYEYGPRSLAWNNSVAKFQMYNFYKIHLSTVVGSGIATREGSREDRVPPWQRKISQKTEKRGRKLGKSGEKREKNREKEEKSGRFFHFAPPDR